MTSYYKPNLTLRRRDRIRAVPETTWGNVSEALGTEDGQVEILVLDTGSGIEHRDEYRVMVDGTEKWIHMDTITDIFRVADDLRFERGVVDS